jgi:tetratricopeptide (TPR) repeat protein
MTRLTICPVTADGERIHRYVAGTLEPGPVEEFEIHLLTCVHCQAAVREGVTVRAGLRAKPEGLRPAAKAGRRAWWLVPAAAAATLVWLLGHREGPLARLGGVEPAPAFTGLPIRGTADSAAALADRGLAAYRQGRYPEAARLLAAAATLDSSPTIRYYQGLAELLGHRPRRALASFAAVLTDRAGPYAMEANFYSAKAWLRLGQADSALASLGAIVADSGPLGARARALTDSVKEVNR